MKKEEFKNSIFIRAIEELNSPPQISGCMEAINLSAKKHIPSLDGLRGLAILLVLMCHLSERFTFGSQRLNAVKNVAFAGWTGVDLFFVLSGFLITGILLDSKEDPHYFRNFYARRTLRIFPIYYVTLLAIFVVLPGVMALIHHAPSRAWQTAQEQINWYAQTRQYWGWYVTYFVDLLIALKGFVPPGHFWTLAVEEHFYLIWPFLVYFLRPRALVFTSVGIIAGAFILRAALVPFVNPVAIYVLTPCRMDGLAFGALIALLIRTPEGLTRLRTAARWILPVAALIWLGLMLYLRGWWQYGGLAQTIGYTVTIFFYGSFLVVAVSSTRITSILSGRALRFFGKYSYGIYVFHVFALFFFAPFFALGDFSRYSIIHAFTPDQSFVVERRLWLLLDGLLYVVVAVGASVAMSLISWHILEEPFLRLKRYFPMKNESRPIESKLPVLEQIS
jgi:peptidoglycan/LPS O-acetylase OafA/YrhL